MGGGRWVLPGVGSALVATLLATATSLSFTLQSPERDWAPEAEVAARQSVLDRAPDGDGVEFADVEVRRTGDEDERWVCGSVAMRDEDGAIGPFRDFWVTVARVPGTGADIREVRANAFGRDDFLDRTSAHFRACFAAEQPE